jgi:hypothetical protein
MDISTVEADAVKLNKLWQTAQQQYEARRAALAAQLDSYVDAHQSAADNHTAEIDAANKLKATLVPAVASVETAASELNSFLLTTPWYKKLVAFCQRNWRWVAYGGGLAFIVYVGVHLHK